MSKSLSKKMKSSFIEFITKYKNLNCDGLSADKSKTIQSFISEIKSYSSLPDEHYQLKENMTIEIKQALHTIAEVENESLNADELYEIIILHNTTVGARKIREMLSLKNKKLHSRLMFEKYALSKRDRE